MAPDRASPPAGPEPAALQELALLSGASAAAVIRSAAVRVDGRLARMCRTGCGNYGLAAGCPPHVGGPAELRRLAARLTRALVFRVDLPAEELLSGRDPLLLRPVHCIAAAVEEAALARGAVRARGLAGGSCLPLFCADRPGCRVVEEGGGCLHPRLARPSMSGFGIDVQSLFRAAGWSLWRGPAGEPGSLGSLAGLVLWQPAPGVSPPA
jgi:predicted metal-binding protein